MQTYNFILFFSFFLSRRLLQTTSSIELNERVVCTKKINLRSMNRRKRVSEWDMKSEKIYSILNIYTTIFFFWTLGMALLYIFLFFVPSLSPSLEFFLFFYIFLRVDTLICDLLHFFIIFFFFFVGNYFHLVMYYSKWTFFWTTPSLSLVK